MYQYFVKMFIPFLHMITQPFLAHDHTTLSCTWSHNPFLHMITRPFLAHDIVLYLDPDIPLACFITFPLQLSWWLCSLMMFKECTAVVGFCGEFPCTSSFHQTYTYLSKSPSWLFCNWTFFIFFRKLLHMNLMTFADYGCMNHCILLWSKNCTSSWLV